MLAAPLLPSTEPAEQRNIAAAILLHAKIASRRVALVSPLERDSSLSFGALGERVARLRDGLRRQGIRPGDRVLVLAPLGFDMIAIAVALLASGATLVTLDGQLGARRVVRALAVARPRAVISLRRLLRFWPLVPALARARRVALDGAGLGTQSFAALVGDADESPLARPDAPAMISFSSGTSGRPKGAERTHEILLAQHRALGRSFPVAEGEVDLPAFPALTLHNLACGITTVLPPVDLRQPAHVDPARVVDTARRYGVTSLSGAPAYLARIAAYATRVGLTLPSLRRIAVGGAPVSRSLCRALRAAFPAAEAVVVYGSTEAEPMAHVDLDEVVHSDGRGFLVGTPDPAAEIELVRLPAEPPAGAGDRLRDYRVAAGEVGEIVVRGRHVVQRYVGDPEAQRCTKLPSAAGGVWHRTGDLARQDARGRLWLAGRAADVLSGDDDACYPFDVEANVLDCAGVRAAALVAWPRRPEGVLAVALEPGARAAALDAARAALDTCGLSSLSIRVLDELPMDARHQSKVDRVALRAQLAHGREGRP
ncbi:MAG: AMP-binding protein [Polyangia bacterium]